jgi:hypothetical protein
LHAAVFHRRELLASWSSPGDVHSLEEFGPALDLALAELGFAGTDALLLLEHDAFIHRIELAPSSSPGAARSYLQARVAREGRGVGPAEIAADRSPFLWCAQRMAATRQDATFILHLLPASFFEQLNQTLRARRLELTRIFPLSVPLQLALDAQAAPGQPLLMAAGAGGATTIVVGWAGGRLAFARTFFASWTDEPARVGGEINRSLLYAKQQLGTAVDRICLFGAEPVEAEVRARCGEGKEIVAGAATPLAWLEAMAPLSPGHPGNLLSDHLRRKRRLRFVRAAMAAVGWLGVAILALTIWQEGAAGRAEATRFAAVQVRAPALQAERDRLAGRNRAAAEDRDLLQEMAARRLPPTAARFLAYLGGTLPQAMRLTDFQVEETGPAASWSFQIAGTLRLDEESARAVVTTLQQQLEQGPWRAHATSSVSVPAASGESSFSLGGTLLEN